MTSSLSTQEHLTTASTSTSSSWIRDARQFSKKTLDDIRSWQLIFVVPYINRVLEGYHRIETEIETELACEFAECVVFMYDSYKLGRPKNQDHLISPE